MAEQEIVSDYATGFEAGKRQAQNEALATVAALVTLLGGEVRLPERLLVEQDRFNLHRWDDPETREVVLEVTNG